MDAVSPFGEIHVQRTPAHRHDTDADKKRVAVTQSPADDAETGVRHRQKRYTQRDAPARRCAHL